MICASIQKRTSEYRRRFGQRDFGFAEFADIEAK
jgi:hypothetical protein